MIACSGDRVNKEKPVTGILDEDLMMLRAAQMIGASDDRMIG
jgi:hypothetical protein